MRRLLFVFLWVLAIGPAEATTYYTAKTGNDSVNCTQAQSTSTPKLTIAGGISCLSAGGDILFVRTGIYAENINSGVPSGSVGNYVRIAAYFPETVTLRPSGGFYALSFTASEQYVEWDGINIDGTNLTGSNVGDNVRVEACSGAGGNNPHHIRIKNSVMLGTTQNTGNISSQPQMVQFIMAASGSGCQGGNELLNCTLSRGGGNQDFAHAVYASSTNNIIDGNDISGFLGIGVQIYNGYAQDPSGNIIRNNVIHDGATNSGYRTYGILVSGSSNQVYNNVIYNMPNSASQGIDIFGDDPVIYNNTVYSAGVGLYIYSQSGAIIRNNILYSNTTNYDANGFSPTEDHNSRAGADPSFIDAAAHNFRLQNSSIAKDTGVNTGTIATIVTTDKVGTTRPQGGTYDLGAYEYTTGSGGPGGVSYVPATGTITTTDTFTGTTGDALVATHTGETGAMWATQTTSSTGLVITDLNRVRLSAPDVDTFTYASGTPISGQYDVRGELHTFTTITDHTVILWARMSTSVRTGYMAIYNRVPATLELWAVVANVYTELGSCSVTFADGSDNTLEIQVRTGAQQLWYYPTASPATTTQCFSGMDTSITQTGLAGIGMYAPTAADTNSTGIHLDKFVVQDVATSGASATCAHCRFRFKR